MCFFGLMGLHLSTQLYCLVDFLLFAYLSVHHVMSLYLYRCVAGVLLTLVNKGIPPPAEHLLFPLYKVRFKDFLKVKASSRLLHHRQIYV